MPGICGTFDIYGTLEVMRHQAAARGNGSGGGEAEGAARLFGEKDPCVHVIQGRYHLRHISQQRRYTPKIAHHHDPIIAIIV